ncbi:MAG: zinc ribbon domain-containing protein [Oscillospiraceae bacterium]|nr:zinc ribbon domain-containing protein [Oscillospiraceae bacterium]
MNAYCTDCGNPIAEGYRFCSKCGKTTVISSNKSAEATEVPPPPQEFPEERTAYAEFVPLPPVYTAHEETAWTVPSTESRESYESTEKQESDEEKDERLFFGKKALVFCLTLIAILTIAGGMFAGFFLHERNKNTAGNSYSISGNRNNYA